MLEKTISFGKWLKGMPSNRISPSHGKYSPLTSLDMVDLPHPELPTKAIELPQARRKEKFSINGGCSLLYPKEGIYHLAHIAKYLAIVP